MNAGHNAPVVALAGGPFDFLVGPRHPVIGVVADRAFAPGEVTLAPGSVLVLYTDGVTDARSAAGEAFGESRLLAALNAAPDRSATRLVEEVIAAALYRRDTPGRRPCVDGAPVPGFGAAGAGGHRAPGN